jgi:hypothetical protein
MANRGLDQEQIALLNLQARANLLSSNTGLINLSPVVGDIIQLYGPVEFYDKLCEKWRSRVVYTAYGRNTEGGYTGFWAVTKGWGGKQSGQVMQFKAEFSEHQAHEALLGHAQTWLEQSAESGQLDDGYWTHNRVV